MVHVIKAVWALRPATESDGTAQQECSLWPGCCGPLDAVKNAPRSVGRSCADDWASSSSLRRRSNSGIKLNWWDEAAWSGGGIWPEDVHVGESRTAAAGLLWEGSFPLSPVASSNTPPISAPKKLLWNASKQDQDRGNGEARMEKDIIIAPLGHSGFSFTS